MPTLNQVAQESGLAVSTVSQILCDRPGYPEATRRRVREVARRLGYRPNPIGRALRGGKSMDIGVLSHPSESVIRTCRTRGIEWAAREGGYSNHMVTVPDNSPKIASIGEMNEMFRGLIERHVDGIVVALSPNTVESAKFSRVMSTIRIPVVFLDAAPPNCVTRVMVSREEGYRELGLHLAQLGHREAMMLPLQSRMPTARGRLSVVRRGLTSSGVNCVFNSRLSLPAGDDDAVQEACYAQVRALARSKNLPTVLLLYNDHQALAALAALQDAGLRVPEDISVVGFDDIPDANFMRPSLTTILQPREEAGRAAFAMLHQLMRGGDSPCEPMRLNCHLVARNSTGPARTTS